MKVLALSYLRLIDRLILSSLTPERPTILTPPANSISLRGVYGHLIERRILQGIHVPRLPHKRSVNFQRELVELSPSYDILVICDAPLLARSIVESISVPMVNIHFGLSRYYRGMHTVFWPLWFEDYDHIGMTFHYVDSGIDTGPIILEYFPFINPGDTELTIWLKLTKAANRLLPRVVDEVVNQKTEGWRSWEKGRLFLSRERSVRKELLFRWKEMWKNRRIPARSERVIWRTNQS